MATASEGANPRQTRVTRDSAGPIFGATVHLALAGTTAVGGAVDPVVGCVVRTDDGPEDLDAAGWSALGDAQPEPAREATKTTVAMIRTGRMATPPTTMTLWAQDSRLAWAGSPHGRGRVSPQPRTGVDLVAIYQPTKHAL
jgi:hypothetical protein